MFWGWIILLFMALSAAGYFAYTVYSNEESPITSMSDTIVITENGTKKVETYMETPRASRCHHQGNNPEFCTFINKNTEMNYAYDITGGDIDTDGSFITTYDANTDMCSDGTTDCLYEEKFDENRKLIGIMNTKGEDLITVFIDDVWSGKIKLDKMFTDPSTREPITFKELIKKTISFDKTTGEIFINRGDGVILKIIPGIMSDDSEPVEGEMKVPVGMTILWIIFYYYTHELPRPIIKLDFTSQHTFGDVYTVFNQEKKET